MSRTLTSQLYRLGAHPSNPRFHVEHNRRDRDPDHALPHPYREAASRNCSARGQPPASAGREGVLPVAMTRDDGLGTGLPGVLSPSRIASRRAA